MPLWHNGKNEVCHLLLLRNKGLKSRQVCHLPYPAWFPKHDFFNRAQLGNEIAERHDLVPILLPATSVPHVSGLKERSCAVLMAPRFLLQSASTTAHARRAGSGCGCGLPRHKTVTCKVRLKNESVHVQSLPVISTSFTADARSGLKERLVRMR